MGNERETGLVDSFSARGEWQMEGVAPGNMPAIPVDGSVAIGIFGGVITAQQIAAKRNMGDVKRRLSACAAFAGMDYVYAWDVNDRKNNRKVHIEGPTIVLANDLAREWGNCQVDVRVMDEGRHWMFYGRFVDLETGYSLVRGYQQRKAQNTGMGDDQRALDMVFQIGQSKCIRNVIVNALRSMADFCVEEAKKGLLKRVEGNPEGARASILKMVDQLGVKVDRIEKIYGRTSGNWTHFDMAKIFSELTSIKDNMASADDIYGDLEQKEPAKAAGAAGDAKITRNVILTDGGDGSPLMDFTGTVKAGDVIKGAATGTEYVIEKFDDKNIFVKAAPPTETAKAVGKKGAKKETPPATPAAETPPAEPKPVPKLFDEE